MALRKYKLGELLEILDVRNADLRYGADRVRGVNNLKKLMPTKADLATRDLSKFQIVAPGDFVFNHRTSRNGSKFSIAFNDGDDDVICTEDYVVFRVKKDALGILSPLWLYMYFNRAEFDRYVITNSWGSSTEFFNWEDLCDVEIDLPPLSVQEKYVAVYQAMLANQSAYEKGLDDLKLACDATVEKVRKNSKTEKLGRYIRRVDVRNGKQGTRNVKSVSIYKEFREPTSKVDRDELSNYKVVKPRQVTFVQTTNNEKVFAFALNDTSEDVVVTPVNEVFEVDEKSLTPEYLAAFCSRREFDRYARFHSWGSARETFTWDDLCSVNIPLPDLSTQKAIGNLYQIIRRRKQQISDFKSMIAGVAPILIRGSLDEAAKGSVSGGRR